MEKEQYEILFRVEEAHWWYLGMRAIVASLLERHLDANRRHRILDAGCGTGGMSSYLGRFGSVVGLDGSLEALCLAKKRRLRDLVLGSVEQVPFESDSFDLVTSFDVIYHRAVKDDRRALAEFYRVLAPGGHLVIRVPAYDWLRAPHDLAVHTRHRYTRGELARRLEDAGLRLRTLTYVNSLLFPLATLVRLMENAGMIQVEELALPPEAINQVLLSALKAEARLIRAMSLPWGLSVLAVATK